MEAGLMNNYCWNGSGIEKNNIAEKEAKFIKTIAEMEAHWWKKYCGNFAEIKAGFTKNIGEWKRDFL